MKKWLRIILFSAFFIFLMNNAFALSNPSAVYCEDLGYKYQTNKTINGDVGVCIINEKVQFDAWSFFEGKTGQKYSYCAKNGYSIKTLTDGNNSFSEEYAVCFKDDFATGNFFTRIFLIFLRLTGFAVNEEPADYTSVTDMMNLSEKIPDELQDTLNLDLTKKVDKVPIKIITEFDWRNNDGNNWMTPVKNQGSCGSCWAFSTLGAVESKIKIERNDSNFNIDLSEQDLVSCAVPFEFYPGAGGCSGATLEDPLNYTQDIGVTDEDCFSYTASDASCSNKCSSWKRRLWNIDDYGYIYSPEDMKSYITKIGPIVAGIYMAGSFVDGIYTCKKPADNLNHAVVIVGYNDSGKYWVVRNSWGSNWNEDGYFKVGYKQCNIESYPIFVNLEIRASQKINTNNILVSSGIAEGNYSNLYFIDNSTMTYKETCNDSNCDGYDIQNVFSVNGLSNITSLDAVSYQNSSRKQDTFLDYWNENNSQWESLGTISQNNYIIKYKLCSSPAECLNYFSLGNIFLRYSHTASENSSVDYSSLNMLYLEAKATSCTDNWVLNDTWSSCKANDTQYKNYYDLNKCYQNISYLNRTESQSCDYCVPNVTQINTSCEINDNFVSWYNDSNKCYQQTGLESDNISDNQTQSCDYCAPNWTANEICNPDNSSTIWYEDSNSCFLITNLSSDLEGKIENQTLLNSCNYTDNNPENTTNVTEFCGDGICNGGETCSSCSLDCGACPSSGGGGGGGGGGIIRISQINTTNSTTPVVTPNNQETEQNQPITETPEEKNSPQAFSLTGLIVNLQNNNSIKIVLVTIIAIGMLSVVLLFNKNRFSRKNISKNIVKIMRKRKRK